MYLYIYTYTYTKRYNNSTIKFGFSQQTKAMLMDTWISW